MKTENDYLIEMESANVLTGENLTFPEYVAELQQFQDTICKVIAGEAYYEDMRIDAAKAHLERIAREKGCQNAPAVRDGVKTLNKMSREIAITMSGAKGENVVWKTLAYLNRPNTALYRNVYVTDGQEQTELDVIVLTDSAIIVLENKKVSKDITFTEDGRMVFTGGECYDKSPLGERMALKRSLLKKRLEKMITDRGLNIPVYVDSFIVLSAPKGTYLRVNDNYHKEKYCFRTNLNNRLRDYIGDINYEAEQMQQLNAMLTEMECNVRRFDVGVDYDQVRRSIAGAMAALQIEPTNESRDLPEKQEAEYAKVINLNEARKSSVERNLRKVVGIASGLTFGALMGGTAFKLIQAFHNK